MAEPEMISPSFCSNCGTRLRPAARFCSSCGQAIAPRPGPAAGEPAAPCFPAGDTPRVSTSPGSGGTGAEASPAHHAGPGFVQPEGAEPGSQPAAPQPSLEQAPGYRITLEWVPPQARGRVILALRQALGLSPQDAGLYVAAAPILLAVGLPPETAEMVHKALANAGAQVSIQEPPPPPAPVRTGSPPPEPHRRIAKVAETLLHLDPRLALRTVTGLDIGNTATYLAFSRAYGDKLVAPPEMLRFESRNGIPTAIQPARLGSEPSYGAAALSAWIKDPDSVHTQLMDKIGAEDAVLPVMQRFLEAVAGRLVEVLTPSALSIADGAATNLGIPVDWDQGRVERLMYAATEAGFPIGRVAPRPLAALTYHIQQGTLKPGPECERTMVIDWGGSSLAISFVEHGPDLPKPQVFEHCEHPLGGDWLDDLLLGCISGQIPSEMSQTDRRELRLFTRQFKEQMSRAFAEGKKAFSQYCVIPAGSAPVRVRLDQAEWEDLIAEGRGRLQAALADSVAATGLQPEHLHHVILAGGGAHWYFAREEVRSILGLVPLIGSDPEEVFARGLAGYRLQVTG